ncbi:MAG TPA: L,D-transpeptidase [Aestuariivirgaceae bacterium]|jgi:lipoprotein-anchoring transpeptidase ErfK/SrfK
MKYLPKAMVLLAVAALAGTGFASMGEAATTKQKRFYSIYEVQKKKARTARTAGECSTPFTCLFRTTRRTGSGSFFTGFGGRGYRQTVAFNDPRYSPGSIIVRTPERALYYVLPEGEAIRYRVGVGREGFQWSGSSRIVSKKEWPAWTPPAQMIAREAAKGITIPTYMEGGPRNPLGARALYIGGTIYRIHGTNNSRSIGGAVSSGCIRMMNADVIDLYNRVNIGARVHVIQ